MGLKETEIAQTILKNIYQVGKFTLPDFLIYYKTTVIKSVLPVRMLEIQVKGTYLRT